MVLEANSKVTWRDLQHLVARNSKKISPSDNDWQKNGGGLYVNVRFGFGALDTKALVAAAKGKWWRTAPPQKVYHTQKQSIDMWKIPSDRKYILGEIKFNRKKAGSCITKLEHVHVVVTLRLARYGMGHYRGKHSITLLSPAGTFSDILRQRKYDATSGRDAFVDFEFLTVFHWDEDPEGSWYIKVMDHSETGPYWLPKVEFTWSLKFYGTCASKTRYPRNNDFSKSK